MKKNLNAYINEGRCFSKIYTNSVPIMCCTIYCVLIRVTLIDVSKAVIIMIVML